MRKYDVKDVCPPEVDTSGLIFEKYIIKSWDGKSKELLNLMKEQVVKETVPGMKSLLEIVKLVTNLSIDYIQKYPLFELPTELNKDTLSYMLA